MSVYVRCAARHANYRWRAILRAAGEFYKERTEGSGFVTLRRDKAYLCTRSGFVSLRRDKPKGSPLHNAMASNIARKGRVLQGEQERDPASLHYAVTRHTFVLDPASLHYAVTSRRVRRSKACQLPQADPSSLCNAVADNIASSWRVLQGKSRGSVPLYSTEAKDAVRLARCRKIVRLI